MRAEIGMRSVFVFNLSQGSPAMSISSSKCLALYSYCTTRKRSLLVLTICVALFLTGCANEGGVRRSRPASTQDQAGTVLVSPTMVAPWDEVSASLKPNFALTGDQATTQVLPVTESITQQTLSAIGASLAIGLPTTSATSKTVSGSGSVTTTETTERAPGVTPALSNTLPASTSLPAISSPASIGLDPSLKYKAANYLLQQVQLLNQEIDGAASRSCYAPYLVRMKLAVMNFRPGLPYSVHEHIGFGLSTDYLKVVAGAPNECRYAESQIAVIPLLVADDVQTAFATSSAEVASQLALGLSALQHGAGIAANTGALHQDLTAISNHVLSSSLTIGRESESSIYALITPNNQASDQASLVSQTYDVAVLLLVPRFYFGAADALQPVPITLSTYSQYRDASSGVVLPEATEEAKIHAADQIMHHHLSADAWKKWVEEDRNGKLLNITALTDAIEIGSLGDFIIAFCDVSPSQCEKQQALGHLAPVLWNEFGSLLDYDPVKQAVFEAPLPPPIRIPSQQVLLVDDGVNPIQTSVGGVTAKSATKLSAFLNVTPFDPDRSAALDPIMVPSQSLSLNTSAHTLTLTFPSLAKLGIKCLAPMKVSDAPAAASAKGRVKRKNLAKVNVGTQAKCPPRGADAGTQTHPNRILLTLVDCDPNKQLCPDLTDTAGLSQPSIATNMKPIDRPHEALISAKTQLDLVQDKLQTLQGRLRSGTPSKGVTPPPIPSSSAPVVDGAKEDKANLGVTLISTEKSTDPAKVSFSNTGQVIQMDGNGTGKLVVTVSVSSSSDTIGVSIQNAALSAIVDNAGAAVPFDSKLGFVLPQSGLYTFQLVNMADGALVTLIAQALRGNSKDGAEMTATFRAVATKTGPAQPNH